METLSNERKSLIIQLILTYKNRSLYAC